MRRTCKSKGREEGSKTNKKRKLRKRRRKKLKNLLEDKETGGKQGGLEEKEER